MVTIDLWKYAHFGISLIFLRQAKEGFPVHVEHSILYHINRFLQELEEFELFVSLRSRSISNLHKFKEQLQKTKKNHLLSVEEKDKLFEIMDRSLEVVEAELLGKLAYVIKDKRMDVNKLFSSIKELLAPRVYEKLPEITQYDFSEAGKCVVFDRPTAAAFHVLRGTEGTLSWFCELITKTRGAKKTWGSLIKCLKDYKEPPPQNILDQLYNIKENYRNPTAHPEKIYDIEETQDLFQECIAIINRMVNYLEELELVSKPEEE